jgi:hypothetical protein
VTFELVPRPKLHLRDVTTTLADFAIVTWAIAPERLALTCPTASRPTS